MSVAASASQFADLFTRFLASKPEDFLRSGVNFSDFDGPNPAECEKYLNFIRSTFEPLITTGELSLITKQSLNNFIAQLQNLNSQYSNLTNSRDQSSFQNFAMALDQFVFHTRMYGVPLLAAGGAQLEAQRAAFSSELQSLTKNNAEVEALKKDVRTLITPAIAGSLSEAFHQRRDKIYKGRVIWLIACAALGVAATYATFDFVNVVTDAANVNSKTPTTTTNLSLWTIIAIRSVFLIPLFAAFGFAFAQYRKERDFEEEYAHKAAVANSLPNYGDLAREQNVRDQIVTAATTVIFTSPSEQARKAESSSAMLGNMKEVIDTMSKALGKK